MSGSDRLDDCSGLSVSKLLGVISSLRAAVAELKSRLAQTSQNSSKPPSSDNFTKK